MSHRGTHGQMQDSPATERRADLRAERAAECWRVPLIVAALLALPTIIVQESDLEGPGRSSPWSWTGASGVCLRPFGHHAHLGSEPAALVDPESSGLADSGVHSTFLAGDA